jgi:hypothetical protein
LLIPINCGRRSTVPLESGLTFRERVGILAIVTLERLRLLLPDDDRNVALFQGLTRLARFQVYLKAVRQESSLAVLTGDQSFLVPFAESCLVILISLLRVDGASIHKLFGQEKMSMYLLEVLRGLR